MLLKLDIFYGKETLSVDVRVVKGDQTVKWLSLIASLNIVVMVFPIPSQCLIER